LQRWFPEVFEKYRVLSVFDVLKEYLETERIKVDQSLHQELTTLHDPCNYGRKSQRAFGQAYFEEPRWILQQCCEHVVEMSPNRMDNFCCGGGGGTWAMPYDQERVFYGRVKAKQIKDTGAKVVVAPCHNCRDQIMKSLTKEYGLDVETKYLWELVAESLIVEPWGSEDIEAAHALRDAQYERDGIDLDAE
jgi:Fe-S oxidoreductase